MEYKIVQIEPTIREVEITFSKEEVKPKYDEAYAKVQPSVELKGFRKGKVPMMMIKKLYGASIEADVNEELVNKFLNEKFREEKIDLTNQPELTKLEKNSDGTVTAVLKIEAFDDLILQEYKGIEIDEPVFTVTEDMINYEIDLLRYAKGTSTEVETIDDYSCDVDIEIPHLGENHDGSEEPHTHKSTIALYQKNLKNEFKESFLNKKVGDIFTSEEKSPDGELTKLEITILAIRHKEMAELTPEIISEVTGGKLETAEELAEEYGFKIQEYYDAKSREIMSNNLVKKLVEMHGDIVLPITAVRNEAKAYIQQTLSKHNLPMDTAESLMNNLPGEIHEAAAMRVKIELIMNEIAKREQIEIEDYELEPFIKNEIEKNPSLDPEFVKEKLLENENFVIYFIRKKTMDLLLDFAITNEVPFEESFPELLDSHLDADDDFEEDEFDNDEEFDGDDEFDEDYDDEDEDFEEDDEDFDDDDEEDYDDEEDEDDED